MFLWKSKSKSASVSVSEAFKVNALRIRENIEKDVPNAVYILMYNMMNREARFDPLNGDIKYALWHVGVYVYGREWGYSSKGVRELPPLKDREIRDYPERMEKIGETSRSLPEFKEFIGELSTNLFKARNYNIARHNCIVFSHILCKILCSASVPQYLLDLPSKVITDPLLNVGIQMIKLRAPLGFDLTLTLAQQMLLFPKSIACLLDGVPPSQMLSVLKGSRRRQIF